MRTVLLIVLSLFVCSVASAEMRHTFYERYDPAATSFVYDDTGSATTGDVVSVFTYDLKTIFITNEALGSTEVNYRIEGRCVGELDTWSVLDEGSIGSASADAAKNIAIDVTELVDYLRVGLHYSGTSGTDAINVRGIFRRSN